MPGFDGTGPQGQGAMTGGGFGQCAGNTATGMRPRLGLGNRWGRGGGRNAGQRGYQGAGMYMNPPTPRNTMPDTLAGRQSLDDQIALLTNQLEQLKKQRTDLD